MFVIFELKHRSFFPYTCNSKSITTALNVTATWLLPLFFSFFLDANFENFEVDSLNLFDFLDYIAFGFTPGLFSS